MRDDGTLDDQSGLGSPVDRSDDIPSTDRSTTAPEPSALRLLGLGSLRTRFGSVGNLLAARPGRTRVAVATGAVCCLSLVGLAQVNAGTGDDTPAPGNQTIAQRVEPDAASRGLTRQSASPVAEKANPDASPSPTTKPKPKRIAPVAGLDEAQMDNAKVIVRTGRDMGVPRRALVIAVATAMQESNLYNYASEVLPESQNYPHQAHGWDHDSVGLFQQRPSTGWGPVGRLMDPEFATRQFLTALQEIPGWQDLPLTLAAQAVQVSAFPYAYAQHEWRANEVVNAILS